MTAMAAVNIGAQDDSIAGALALARDGDVAAFTELVALLHPPVYRWATGLAADPDDADEIAQDAFVQVHRRLDQFRGEAPFAAWVYGIVRRIAHQRRRREGRRARIAESTPWTDALVAGIYTTDPGARVDRQRLAAYVNHFFQQLPPRQREIFDLVDLQGYDPAEAATMLDMKQGTVRANLFKARASIRSHVLATHPAWGDLDR
ncbi:MAG TPA: RNA polymerase sigma factor [Gemmatimonadaceae bacterium]|nr:RNA polymerase sigma factor [Gemmatimonadaceae bacterium]